MIIDYEMKIDMTKAVHILLVLTLASMLLVGCGAKKSSEVEDKAAMAVKEETSSDEETEAVGEEVPEKQDTEETASSEETDNKGVRQLSGEELLNLEKDFNNIRYNGFLVQEFANPESIFWDEVFYLGAGMGESIYDSPDLEKEYKKESGFEELDTDVTIIDRKKAEAFAEATTGLSYSEMKHPISYLLLKDADVYAHAHGDTNQMGIKLLKGSEEDGVTTVRYICDTYHEAGETPTEYEIRFKKEGDSYKFISNLWEPEEGREEAIKNIYNGIIAKYAKGISECWGMDKFEDNNLNYLAGFLKDKTSLGDNRDPLEIAGYYFFDIDDDGIEELFIGENQRPEDEYRTSIYEVYSIKGGDWTRVLSGGERDRYYLSSDGTFYNEGSGSAFNSVLIHYRAEGPYKFLEPIDGVIYDSNYKRPDGGCWYYSEDDFWNTENAKPISEKEYDDYYKKAEDSYVNISYTPFITVETGERETAKSVDTDRQGEKGYTEEQIINMALDYYEKKNNYRPGCADIDNREGDIVTIWLFDDMGDHTSTCAYYDIDINTGKGTDTVFGNEVDLTK